MSAISENNEAIKKMTSVIENLNKASDEILKDNDNGKTDIIISTISLMSTNAAIIGRNIGVINNYITTELERIEREKREGEANGN